MHLNLVRTLLVAFLMGTLSCEAQKSTETSLQNENMPTSIHDLSFEPLQGGDPISFKTFEGKKILLVNVASECGYTPQYAQLEELYQSQQDKLVVIGVPSNQFGGQEPGTAEEIAKFCKLNYGVTFPLAKKQEVKGANQSPIYQFLTSKETNGLQDYEVQWNFNKFLVDEQGKVLAYFPSSVEPISEEILSKL